MENLETIVDFDKEFGSRVSQQRMLAEDLLSESEDAKSEFPLDDSVSMKAGSIFRKNDECEPLKDKRKYKLELGKLNITIKKGVPVNVEGLTISRESVDALLAEIFVYDKAIVNICKQLVKLSPPNSEDERKFILALMDEQQQIVESYTSFKTAIANSRSEDQIMKNIENKA